MFTVRRRARRWQCVSTCVALRSRTACATTNVESHAPRSRPSVSPPYGTPRRRLRRLAWGGQTADGAPRMIGASTGTDALAQFRTGLRPCVMRRLLATPSAIHRRDFGASSPTTRVHSLRWLLETPVLTVRTARVATISARDSWSRSDAHGSDPLLPRQIAAENHCNCSRLEDAATRVLPQGDGSRARSTRLCSLPRHSAKVAPPVRGGSVHRVPSRPLPSFRGGGGRPPNGSSQLSRWPSGNRDPNFGNAMHALLSRSYARRSAPTTRARSGRGGGSGRRRVLARTRGRNARGSRDGSRTARRRRADSRTAAA